MPPTGITSATLSQAGGTPPVDDWRMAFSLEVESLREAVRLQATAIADLRGEVEALKAQAPRRG